MARCLPAVVLLLVWPLASAAVERSYAVDPGQSTVEVDVAKAGLFSLALHDHRFRAELWEGTVRFDPNRPQALEAVITVDAASLHEHEPGLSASDEREVDRTARGPQLLDVATHPTVRFEAHGATLRREGDRLTGSLEGTLMLRGRSRRVRLPVQARVDGARLEAQGTLSFAQTAFGIRPYRRALGAVAVKDEVTVRFRLRAEAR